MSCRATHVQLGTNILPMGGQYNAPNCEIIPDPHKMPIFQAFLPFFLLVGISIPGQVQAQDPATDDPVQATSNDVPASAGGELSLEPSVPPQEESLAPPSDPLSLYSPDILVDMPYVYPLLRMRLTPEMRQEAP